MFFITFYGPPGGIRTHYPRLRRPVLYPDELRADALLITTGIAGVAKSCPASLRATGLRGCGCGVYKETVVRNVDRTQAHEYPPGGDEEQNRVRRSIIAVVAA